MSEYASRHECAARHECAVRHDWSVQRVCTVALQASGIQRFENKQESSRSSNPVNSVTQQTVTETSNYSQWSWPRLCL